MKLNMVSHLNHIHVHYVMHYADVTQYVMDDIVHMSRHHVAHNCISWKCSIRDSQYLNLVHSMRKVSCGRSGEIHPYSYAQYTWYRSIPGRCLVLFLSFLSQANWVSYCISPTFGPEYSKVKCLFSLGWRREKEESGCLPLSCNATACARLLFLNGYD